MEELVGNHLADVTRVLEVMGKNKMICSPSKSKFLQLEVEFCGHVLSEGVRMQSPGKLLPLQKWELPQTVTGLRWFLGITNYSS